MRSRKMRRHLLVPVISILVLVKAPVARGDVQYLRWGGDAEGGAPYVFVDPRDPQKTIGFEVDLANALAQKLHRRAVFVQNQWDGLISGLERGDYDIVLNGLEITADREREINFTIPYYATTEQLSVRKDNHSIHSDFLWPSVCSSAKVESTFAPMMVRSTHTRTWPTAVWMPY